MNELLEICVDSYESALLAASAGATRLELCGCLPVGGLSPSPWLIRQVRQAVSIPIRVLLRPRFGDFCCSPQEKQELLAQIRDCAQAGVEGAVIGALLPDGSLDVDFLAQCRSQAPELGFTLHRGFDVCLDPFAALEQAISLGFDTLLTSGQAPTAPQGLELLAELQARAGGRIHIMAGSGVTAAHIPALYAAGLRQFHLSAKTTRPGPMEFRREGVPMGLPLASEYDRIVCDPSQVQAAASILHEISGKSC